MLDRITHSLFKGRIKQPLFLILFVTNRCNLSCSHCFYVKKMSGSQSPLSLEEIQRVSSEMGDLLETALSGGEPFLRDDLFEIFKTFADGNNTKTFVIPTNGLKCEKIEDDIHRMLSYKKVKNLTVVISLDGPQKIHDQIRGAPCFDSALKTIKILLSFKKKYSQLRLRVNSVLNQKTAPSLSDLHETLKLEAPGLDNHDIEIDREASLDLDTLFQARPIVHGIWKHYHRGGPFTHSRAAFKVKCLLYDAYLGILKTNTQPFACLAGNLHCVIDYQGDLSFCEAGPKIGNLRENSFSELWGSLEADKVRAFIKARRCACINSCFQTTNLIFNQRHWPKLLF